MHQQDIEIYKAWMRGDSVGSLAKRYKLDKSQIKKVINRVGNKSNDSGAEVVYELPTEKTS